MLYTSNQQQLFLHASVRFFFFRNPWKIMAILNPEIRVHLYNLRNLRIKCCLNTLGRS
mgnify:CR=1 FL=1